MPKIILYILCPIFFLLASNVLIAQDELAKDSNHEQTNFDKPIKVFKMKKTPMGAIWRSLILPGWGHYYIEDYWKIPIVAGAAGTLGFFVYYNQSKYNDTQDQIREIEQNDPTSPLLTQYKARATMYNNNRDQTIFYLFAVYVVTVIDAYVGSHLFDFDVSDEYNVQIAPMHSINSGFGLGLRVGF